MTTFLIVIGVLYALLILGIVAFTLWVSLKCVGMLVQFATILNTELKKQQIEMLEAPQEKDQYQ